MRTLGILAHVDAGKTTLSERMLWLAGTIRQCGEVEEGLATLDFLPEEQKRGITIETGIEQLRWRDQRVQLLDTPGHVDFGSEVSAVLAALDGAVLVVSGVRHLQTQTLSAWKRLEEAAVPVLVFINRLDLVGSDVEESVVRLEDELGISPLLLTWPLYKNGELRGVIDVLNRMVVWCAEEDPRQVSTEPIPEEWKNLSNRLFEELVAAAAEEEESLFELYLKGETIPTERLIKAIAKRVAKRELLPTYCGSAKRSIAVRQLLNGVVWLLPQGRSLQSEATVRIVRPRWSAQLGRWYTAQAMRPLSKGEGHFPAQFSSLHAGQLVPTDEVQKGELFALTSPQLHWRAGDLVGSAGRVISSEKGYWGEPLLEERLEPIDDQQHKKLREAVELLAESDPALRFRIEEDGGMVIAGLGEVHLEVTVERLRREFGAEFRVGKPVVPQRERWVGMLRHLTLESNDPQFSAKVSLSLLPFEAASVAVVVEEQQIETGLGRVVIQAAIDDFVERGVTGAGRIVHLRVVIHSVSWSGTLLPSLLKKLLDDLFRLKVNAAAVRIEEPYARTEVWTPSEYHGAVLKDLQSRNAQIVSQDSDGYHWRIETRLPLRHLIGYSTFLRSISRGTASFQIEKEEWNSK